MEKEYIKPEFRVVSLESNTDIAAGDLSQNDPYEPTDKDEGFGPWIPIWSHILQTKRTPTVWLEFFVLSVYHSK